MKTQINTLRTGSKNVYRTIENQADYDTNHHFGRFKASTYDERKIVAQLVWSENPEVMTIEIFKEHITLNISRSISGKTIMYQGTIPNEMYAKITDRKMPTIFETKCSIIITPDMSVIAYCNSRKNSNCQWKESSNRGIDESFITIL